MKSTDPPLKIELYRLMDSFLAEAKDQNGNDRSLERLNQDRRLFVDNTLSLIADQWLALIEEVIGDDELAEAGFERPNGHVSVDLTASYNNRLRAQQRTKAQEIYKQLKGEQDE